MHQKLESLYLESDMFFLLAPLVVNVVGFLSDLLSGKFNLKLIKAYHICTEVILQKINEKNEEMHKSLVSGMETTLSRLTFNFILTRSEQSNQQLLLDSKIDTVALKLNKSDLDYIFSAMERRRTIENRTRRLKFYRIIFLTLFAVGLLLFVSIKLKLYFFPEWVLVAINIVSYIQLIIFLFDKFTIDSLIEEINKDYGIPK